MLYGEKQFAGEVHVLSEGHYPNLTSMGCPLGFTPRSVKVVPMVRGAAAPAVRATTSAASSDL